MEVIRYLGIKFATLPGHMITDNVMNLLQIIKQQLEVWAKLQLS